jgi:hypothetical protein
MPGRFENSGDFVAYKTPFSNCRCPTRGAALPELKLSVLQGLHRVRPEGWPALEAYLRQAQVVLPTE